MRTAENKQMRLILPDVTLGISFTDLLGINCHEITEDERRKRWGEWLRLAKADGNDMHRYWCDRAECYGCKHLRGSWCDLQELPCTVNPYLTIKHGMIGMACMGAGRNA